MRSRVSRGGSALVEFALIAALLLVLLGVMLDFGRAAYSAQVLQQAADLIGREMSRTPLPPAVTLQSQLTDPASPLSRTVYSREYLTIDLDGWSSGTLMEYLDTLPLPVGNRQLLPLMYVEDVGGQRLLRYPGALVPSSASPLPAGAGGFYVRIPRVSYDSDGLETIAPTSEWLEVLEPIVSAATPAADPFSLTYANAGGFPPGTVAVRLNYPFQAATLTQSALDSREFTQRGAGMPPAEASTPSGTYGPYAGPEGLGEQAAYVRTVRPYRRILSATAIQRRELFQ